MKTSLNEITPHPQGKGQFQQRCRAWLGGCLMALALMAFALPARAHISVIDCSATSFTLHVSGLASGALTAQLLLPAGGELILETTYNFAAQTVVAVRPSGLAAGTYHLNLYINGDWKMGGEILICDANGGGNGGVAGGRTPGFWSNKNGQALITAADLQGLRDLCLRNANGTDFNPTVKASFGKWLTSSNAKNMANKLSTQLAATYLNVQHGFTNPNLVVDGSLTVNALIVYANSLLCADGNTPSGDPNRAEQERVKDILDRINNGLSVSVHVQ
jgi:hypothetical protein